MERYKSHLHDQFKPAGSIGHPLGIGGSFLLIALLSYTLRKRLRSLYGWGPLSRWLQFHIFCGIAGPVLITLHTAFKLRGIVAISYWSMLTVAVSGMIGRYLYTQIPHALSGKEIQYEELSRQIRTINEQLAVMLRPAHLEQVQRITDFQSPVNVSMPRSVFVMIADDLRWIRQRAALQSILETYSELNADDRHKLAALARDRKLQVRRISMLKASQNLFRHWHVIHVPLAQTMYLTMAIHILVAILTGYF